MNNTLNYENNSYDFSNSEKSILLKFLDYFSSELDNGNGNYLKTLNLDNINFKWCKSMCNDDGIFGAWSPMMLNTVYVRPDTMSLSYSEKQENASNLKMTLDKLKNFRIEMRKGFNVYDFEFIDYLLANDGLILSTIMHELYHKWQFKSAPIFYIANRFLSLFIGYENSCKLSFTIEGDVRKYVDNKSLYSKINLLYQNFLKDFNNIKENRNEKIENNFIHEILMSIHQ